MSKNNLLSDLEEATQQIPDPQTTFDEPIPTKLEEAEYEFATIAYDYKIHPEAVHRISFLLKRLANG